MRKKSISALVGILVVGLLVMLGVYWYRQSRTASAIETTLSLQAKPGALPEDWYITSYEEAYTAYSGEDGIVTLVSQIPDDLRLCKKVTLKGGTRYVLSGRIATEEVTGGRGASLSIDNNSLDKSCVYSQSLYGTNDFTLEQLLFETRPEQTQIIIALRLGGYSEASSGTVRFQSITLTEATGDEGYFQVLTPWGGTEEEDEDNAFRGEEQYKSFFAIIVWAAVLSGVLLLFGIYRNRRMLTEKTLKEKTCRWGFAFVAVVGILLRLALCTLFRGHDTDMNCFIAWGQDIARNGTANFYWAPGREWYDYPPGYMLFLGGYSWVLNLFHVDTASVAGIFLYMLPAAAADVGLALLLMRYARRRNLNNAGALVLGGLVFLNPALSFLSGAWGQIDSILTLLVVLSFLSLLKGKRILSGAVFGLAVMIKWQALMFGPVFAFVHLFTVSWKEEKRWKDLGQTLLAALSAVAVMVVIGLPFMGNQGPFWFVQKFLSASSGYDYATVEAYNYFALCGANWRRAGEYMINNVLTYRQFGTIAIALAILCGAVILLQRGRIQKRQGLTLREDKGAVFLSAAVTMALIFTFGHYMHERYIVPVLVLLLYAYACYKDKRLLLAALLFTISTFLNEMMAMYVVSSGAIDVIRGGREHNTILRLCAAMEVGECLYLGYVVIDLLHNLKGRLGPVFIKEPSKQKTGLYAFVEEGLQK